jgi:uncharacterized protein YbaP (TraB family)
MGMIRSRTGWLRAGLAALVGLLVFTCLVGRAYSQPGSKCLWAVSSGKNTVYLLGSIHLLSRWDYPLDEAFEAAYRDSAVIVFETDLDEMDRPETQALMMQHSLLPKGRHIREVVSPRTFRMLAKHLDAQGLPMVQFEGLRPWVCALTLTMLEVSKRGYLPQYGLDRHFYRQARQDKKKIIPLESVSAQLTLFFELGKGEQDAFLRRTLEDLAIVDTLFPKMLGLWKSGNIEQLDIIMQESFAGHPALYDKFLAKRNARWLPVIEGLIGQSENALVIVGASHLGGKDGLIRSLKHKGYKITR